MRSYKDRLADAKRLYAVAPKEDQPGQKFPRGSRVHVDDEMPTHMFHFPKGFEAIINWTYAQKYWGTDVDSYSLIMLDDDGSPTNAIAWYHECQLTLLSDDLENGKEIIRRYDEI